MEEITLNKQELKSIQSIMAENNLNNITIIKVDDGDGAPKYIKVEYDYVLNGRPVTVRESINNIGEW